MKTSFLSFPVLAIMASSVMAQTDTQILNYALTLEHLENAFYSGALAQYDAAAFEAAGFEQWVRGRFEQIAEHEAEHVQFLKTALGADAVQPCTYSFPYSDPKSFAALSMILEGVGVSAFLGAAAKITNKDFLTAAGSILTTESRHSAWVGAAVNKEQGWSGPFETPLDLDQVFSLASAFITSCPSTNAALPVKAFPALSIAESSYTPGSTITLNFTGSHGYLAILSGLSTIFLSIDDNKKVQLPSTLQGTVYAVVTSQNGTVTDDSTVAGPAILLFPFSSKESN